MATTLDSNRLKAVKVSGKTLTKQLTAACTSASLSASISQVTQLSLTFQDSNDLTLFRGGKLREGTTVSYGAWTTRVGPVKVDPGPAGPTLAIQALSLGVSRLRKQTGSKSWGSRNVSSWVKEQAKAVGFKHIVQPDLGKRTIVREKPEGKNKESTWDVMNALAKELGLWLFEYGNTLVFARPSWLVNRVGRRNVSLSWTDWDTYSSAMTGMPTYSADPTKDLRESLVVRLVSVDADAVRPGDTITLSGNVGGMKGTWIISAVNFPMARTAPVEVTCQRAIDPEKVPPKPPAKKKATGKKKTGKAKAGASTVSASASRSIDAFARKYNGARLDWDGGYGAQCVDLAKAYNETVVGGPKIRGNGKEWVNNCVASGAYTKISARGKARKGDIVAWGPSWGGGYGHVGVVIEDRGSTLYTFDQLSGRTGYHTLSKRGLLGYARPKKWS